MCDDVAGLLPQVRWRDSGHRAAPHRARPPQHSAAHGVRGLIDSAPPLPAQCGVVQQVHTCTDGTQPLGCRVSIDNSMGLGFRVRDGAGVAGAGS